MKRQLLFASLCSLSLLLSGCMVGPKYVTPTVATGSGVQGTTASILRRLGAGTARRSDGARQVVGDFR